MVRAPASRAVGGGSGCSHSEGCKLQQRLGRAADPAWWQARKPHAEVQDASPADAAACRTARRFLSRAVARAGPSDLHFIQLAAERAAMSRPPKGIMTCRHARQAGWQWRRQRRGQLTLMELPVRPSSIFWN